MRAARSGDEHIRRLNIETFLGISTVKLADRRGLRDGTSSNQVRVIYLSIHWTLRSTAGSYK